MKEKSIICFLIFFLFISCNETHTEWVNIKSCTYFNDNSFEKTCYLQSMLFDSLVIQNPVRIALNDTILFSINPSYGSDSLVHYFSTQDHNHLGAMAIRGNGPEEFLSVSNISFSPDSNEFWIYDITKQVWSGKSIHSLRDYALNKEKYETLNLRNAKIKGLTNLFWIGDKFVANSLFKYKERFFIFDSTGIQVKTIINPNLDFAQTENEGVLADVFSTHLAITPNRKEIVLAGRYLDLLEVYDLNGNLQIMLKGPDKGFGLRFDRKRSTENSTLVKSPDTRRSYLAVKATNDKIYALYSGKSKKDKEHYSYSKVIYTFTNTGKPLTKYILDTPISDFAINKQQNRIYAISIDSEIIFFDLTSQSRAG